MRWTTLLILSAMFAAPAVAAQEGAPAGSLGQAKLEKRFETSTLWDAFLHHLEA